MIATRHGFTPVKAGDKLAGTRVIPLVIKKEKMERVKRVAGETPLLPGAALPPPAVRHCDHR